MAAFHCRSAVALHDRLMSVSFTPQPQTLSAAIADRLRQEVLQGQWSPGETINDGMLAARYGVQRPPVREAMQQLSQEVYREWRVVVACAAFFAIHHILFDRLQAWGYEIYCTSAADFQKILLHAIFVVL